MEVRTIAPGERDAVLDLLAEWYGDRRFFARYLEHDPSFRADLCFVAVDDGRFVGTLQMLRKDIRAGASTLSVAAIANVYTTPAYRERGVASQLLELALAAAARERFDVSALFATRLPFYGQFGWRSQLRFFEYFIGEPDSIDWSAPAGAVDSIEPFRLSDLEAVMALYDELNRHRSGTTVRDADYWRGQLRYAGNPHEDFLVARRGGALIAYARATELYDLRVVMEHAYRPGEEAALTTLLLRLGEQVAPMGLLTQTTLDGEVCEQLEGRGFRRERIEDYFWMWRTITPQQVQAKLGLSAEQLASDDLFTHILPPTASVFWLSDRF
ncbi:MAG TPA: GNAT family N-acetyltransferase [Terriglobales bacterium]|nr:GNAT family N-acetyltransferase [Terriglobales bacterium]